MARLKKCTEKDISVLLETSSDSNIEELDKSYVPKKSTDNDSFDLSDSDKIFENKKCFLQTNMLQKEQASLRLKLRRSTEQSMYKIDTESEDERPKRLTRNTKCRLKNLQDENQMPRKGARVIKVPKRYSGYECYSSKSRVSALQRDQINYDEKKLFLDSLDTFEKKQETNKYVKSDDSDCVCVNFIPSPTKTKLNKQKNHAYSIKDTNNIKVHRTRSKCESLSVDEELKDNIDKVSFNNKMYLETDTRQNISLKDTPKRSRSQKNASILSRFNTCESVQHKHENKSKDKVEIIHKVDKGLSVKIQKNDEAIESSVVQNDLNTLKVQASLKQGTLTPSMKVRTDILVKPITPLQEIRTRLHVSAVPKSLPCREEEFNNIYTFLESKLIDNSGG